MHCSFASFPSFKSNGIAKTLFSQRKDHDSKLQSFGMINPLTDDKILDWFKLKQVADNILKCI